MPLFATEQQLSHRGARLRLFDHLPQAAEEPFLRVLPVLRVLQQDLQLDEICKGIKKHSRVTKWKNLSEPESSLLGPE